ncbi:MAG TPA: N-acetylmuramoyl-L-alanine amidase [Sphingomonas sp.]|uniref:N-acetylmuramoyl-L-alanine amidase n=1 Tax=Sphingomonas sp. TaxID=28214 RepID=UPI002CACF6EE|nr:N-acetylmuramoyl-L-alanine amidase [Sphingomonas sp.]HMI18407.1 N-acetylmuramoyl-L-alanine amidase [Sphingomonas sp.]
MTDGILDRPSPNFDERKLPVSMIVIHYTGMCDAASALDRLTDPSSKVSSHYLIGEDGQICRLVSETKRAWHAGKAHWRGIDDVNSASIGIELVNPGHENGYRPFSEAQMEALVPLMAKIVGRYSITRGNIVGHSDVAPARKDDPGELFDWDRLARLRLALPRPNKHLTDPLWSDASFLLALERFGYELVDTEAAVRAFQRRFRPDIIDGVIDGQCRAILLSLLTGGDKGAEARQGRKG